MIAIALLGLAACSEPPEPVQRVRLTGEVVMPDGNPASGSVTVGLFHAWSLDGLLRHPRAEIEWFEAPDGRIAHEFDYPFERGEGLLVYAWHDADGDGVHCTPTVRDDLAGLTAIESLDGDAVNVTVELSAPCAGPDWFYPPAQ